MSRFSDVPDWFERMSRETEMLRKTFEPPASIHAMLDAHDSVTKRMVAEQQTIKTMLDQTSASAAWLNAVGASGTYLQQALQEHAAWRKHLEPPRHDPWRDIAFGLQSKHDTIASLLYDVGLNAISHSRLWARFEETAERFEEASEDEAFEEEDHEDSDDPSHERSLVLPVHRELVLICTEITETMLAEFHQQPALLSKMPPRKFEELVAHLFEGFGYEVELTARTRDGGYDVIAVRHEEIKTRSLIECKRYDSSNKVGVGVVRQLHGVVAAEKATNGIVATTASFTRDAQRFIAQNRWLLEGRDLNGVLDWITRYLRARN